MHRRAGLFSWIAAAGAATALVSGCAATVSSGGAASPPAKASCKLGEAPPAPTPIAVVGYPIPARPSGEIERAALSARVPDWEIRQVGENGFPVDIVRHAEGSTPAQRVRWVKNVLASLAAEYGIVEPPNVTEADGTVVVDFATERPENPQFRVSISPPANPEWIDVYAGAGDVTLPEGAHEISDRELLASWGSDWQSREIQVDEYFEGHPCDPVADDPHSCEGAGPRQTSSCVAATMPAQLRRGTAILDDGVHRVAEVPMAGPRESPMDSRTTTLPTCWDAVSGAVLQPDVCRRARWRDDRRF